MKKIKTISAISIFTLTSQLALALAAHAMPNGSYSQTCRNVYENGNTLYATCKTIDQHWQRTSLRGFDRCVSEITNQNGSLKCAFVYIPEGSYKKSCRDIQVQGENLRATCQTQRGSWKKTSLGNYSSCNLNSIDNLDGLLVCDRK
jgi:CVNH domain